MSGRQPLVRIVSDTRADPQAMRDPYNVAVGPCGDVRVYCANMTLFGTRGSIDGAERVSIVVGQSQCNCGCNRPGRAFEYMPTTDEARELAKRLLEAADDVDRLAKERAAAFIDRVRKAAGQ